MPRVRGARMRARQGAGPYGERAAQGHRGHEGEVRVGRNEDKVRAGGVGPGQDLPRRGKGVPVGKVKIGVKT